MGTNVQITRTWCWFFCNAWVQLGMSLEKALTSSKWKWSGLSPSLPLSMYMYLLYMDIKINGCKSITHFAQQPNKRNVPDPVEFKDSCPLDNMIFDTWKVIIGMMWSGLFVDERPMWVHQGTRGGLNGTGLDGWGWKTRLKLTGWLTNRRWLCFWIHFVFVDLSTTLKTETEWWNPYCWELSALLQLMPQIAWSFRVTQEIENTNCDSRPSFWFLSRRHLNEHHSRKHTSNHWLRRTPSTTIKTCRHWQSDCSWTPPAEFEACAHVWRWKDSFS